MKQSCALADNLGDATACAHMRGVMEGSRKEPKAVDGTTHEVTLCLRENAAVGKVGFPLFEGVDFFPALGNAADLDD